MFYKRIRIINTDTLNPQNINSQEFEIVDKLETLEMAYSLTTRKLVLLQEWESLLLTRHLPPRQLCVCRNEQCLSPVYTIPDQPGLSLWKTNLGKTHNRPNVIHLSIHRISTYNNLRYIKL